MTIPLLNNESLKMFIMKVGLDKEKKDLLFSKLPQLDLDERINLFRTLSEIHLLDLEEEKAIERIKKFWEK